MSKINISIFVVVCVILILFCVGTVHLDVMADSEELTLDKIRESQECKQGVYNVTIRTMVRRLKQSSVHEGLPDQSH